MATKTKAAKPRKRFFRMVIPVPIMDRNAGKPASVRKENAEKEFRQIVFPKLKNHELWDITSITFRGPARKKYLMTIGLKRNNQQGPSSDPKVTKPTTPPPSA